MSWDSILGIQHAATGKGKLGTSLTFNRPDDQSPKSFLTKRLELVVNFNFDIMFLPTRTIQIKNFFFNNRESTGQIFELFEEGYWNVDRTFLWYYRVGKKVDIQESVVSMRRRVVIYMVFTLCTSFKGYANDIFQVISKRHVQRSKYFGKNYTFGGESEKQIVLMN